jgi:hypothetical protein
VLVLVGAAMFFGYRLDSKRHAEIRDALAELEAAEAPRLGLSADVPPTAAPAE